MPRRTGQAGQEQSQGNTRREVRRRNSDIGGVGTVALRRCKTQRQSIAYESARILSEQGGLPFDGARRKAAARLGIDDRRCWPDNQEIQQALLEQQRLFHHAERTRTLGDLRRCALSAMREFSEFDPRLVGATVDGSATREQGVQLQLYTDSAEDVVLELLQRGIPWQQSDDQFRYAGGSRETHPVFGFIAGDIPVHLIVLPRRARRNPPLSPVSQRPDRGIDVTELSRRIDEET